MRTRICRAALAVTLCCCLVISGCNALDQVSKWLPVGLDAFSQVLGILAQTGVITIGQVGTASTDAALVNANFGDLKALVTEYEQAPASSKSAFLGKVTTALSVLKGNLAKVLADVHIVDQNKQLAVQLGIGAMVTTLSAFEAQLSPSPAGKARATPSPGEFKKTFNAAMLKGGFPERQLK